MTKSKKSPKNTSVAKPAGNNAHNADTGGSKPNNGGAGPTNSKAQNAPAGATHPGTKVAINGTGATATGATAADATTTGTTIPGGNAANNSSNTPANGATAAGVTICGANAAANSDNTKVAESATSVELTHIAKASWSGLVKGRTELFNTPGVKDGTTVQLVKFSKSQSNELLSGATGQQTSAVSLTGTIKKTMVHPQKAPLDPPPPQVRRSKRLNHCKACYERDNSRMVQCDTCDEWYHYTCVEVTAGITDRDWHCPYCTAANTSLPKEIPEVPSTNLAPNRLAGTSLTPLGGTKAGSLQQPKPIVPSVQPEKPKSVKLPADDALGKRTTAQDRISIRSGASKRSEARRKAELELRKLEETLKLDKQYLEQKYDLLEIIEGESNCEFGDVVSIHDKLSQVEEWMNNTEHIGNNDSGLELDDYDRQQTGTLAQSCISRGQPQQRKLPEIPKSANNKETLGDNEGFLPGQGSTPNPPRLPRNPLISNRVDTTSGEETICILNRSQLAARHAVSKDLPEFSGRPEDWPLFYAMFNNTTQMCGFSPEENMLRLRKCLKGEALNAVSCELLHPSNVVSVLATLRMLYGSPERIIDALLLKIDGLPAPDVNNTDTVVKFALGVKNLCATIQACDIPHYAYDVSLRKKLVARLPTELWHRWADVVAENSTPTLLDFNNWLYPLAARLHAMGMQRPSEKKSGERKPSEPKVDQRSRGKKEGFLNVHVETEKPKPTKLSSNSDQQNPCGVCKGNCASVAKCKRFTELAYNSRWATIKELKLCKKCLRRHKMTCDQKKPCCIDGCTYLHHPLLHNSKKTETTKPIEAIATPKPTEETARSCNVHQERTSDVLFRFVPVILYGPSKAVHTYAFIDDGSELTLLEQNLADELGLHGQLSPLCLKWTGDGKRLENSSQKVNLEIASTSTNAKKHQLSNVRTVEKLQLRPQTMIIEELQKRFRHLKGLPIESYRDESPRILIGVDHAKLGHVTNSREGRLSEPIGVKTCLGWCVYGRIAEGASGDNAVNSHQLDICPCNHNIDDSLHKAMKEYFAIDSTGVMKPGKLLLSTEDERAQRLLDTLTHRKGAHYESGLLWKYDNVRLPSSEAMARKRWECLRRRMLNDPVLRAALNAKIEDYIAKGYIRKLSDAELKAQHSRVWYLPVFPVINPNKPDKIRIVWDAAAKAHGISLNSVLLKGPDLLTSLLRVLIMFREFRIAVCGDLREMFHQILMQQEDQHCQRFFWGEDDNLDQPSVYVMQVMTFGACCSPTTAQYVKNKHAKLYERDSPAAVHAITEQHYVDDMLVSVETEEEAANLACEVKRIYAEGGFEMRNWLSNSNAVLKRLTDEPVAEKNLNVGDAVTTEKILGMWWNTTKDCFTYKLSARCEEELLSGCRRPTKREVLSTLMLMFDPIGFIAHFLMFLKVLLQEIWRTGVGWNDEIGDKEFEKWLLWIKVLPRVENVEIPRCYRIHTTVNAEVQLHVFTDASENGFAAVAYLRFKDGECIEVAFIGAKTRVAPLRFLSIPRSELQAALLGVRLAKTIAESLSIKVHRRFFHTDSRDVLCWLNSDHRRYTQFVGVRVAEMLDDSEPTEWNWISTKLNVADEGTKWKSTADLSSTGRWFRGPEFLWQPEEEWPATSRSCGSTEEELRPHLMTHITTSEPVIQAANFSDWRVLQRRTAFVQRCALNWRRRVKKEPTIAGSLSRQELIKADEYLYRTAQSDAFADEVAVLSKNRDTTTPKTIPKGSSIYHVCPFLDERDVLRVRGRTGACKYIDADAANPVILPREHHITRLIVAHYHQRFHHQNHNTVVNELRQHYYVPRLKVVYKKVRQACQRCKNDRAEPCPPAMGDLSAGQLAAFTRPFTHMGVDYFGPISVSVGRRSEKRWGVLATCLTTRAIHLEVAYSLSTDSCIMALRNIFARRGTPAIIYSDRGTNFQGASREFREAIHNVDQDRMVEEFTTAHTEWRFNPPAAPHMGGMWERLIKTVKQNLNKMLENRVTSAEVLGNALAEVENLVNSRPLTDIPVEDDYSPVLTPNHFLLLSSNGLKPLVPFDDSARAIGNNYRTSQMLANGFWRQWLRDYRPIITRRTKWLKSTKPIAVDDIVIVVDPQHPRNCWPKGRIIATQPGSGEQVRQATVMTSTGVYERPAVNLAVLDVGVEGNTSRSEPQRIPEGSVSSAGLAPDAHCSKSPEAELMPLLPTNGGSARPRKDRR